MISSTLGSNSGSQQPFMRAKHFEAIFTAITFHHHLYHNYLFFVVVVDWDLGCNNNYVVVVLIKILITPHWSA